MEVKGRNVVVVNIPVTLVHGLIDALKSNIEIYEKAFGKVTIPEKE